MELHTSQLHTFTQKLLFCRNFSDGLAMNNHQNPLRWTSVCTIAPCIAYLFQQARQSYIALFGLFDVGQPCVGPKSKRTKILKGDVHSSAPKRIAVGAPPVSSELRSVAQQRLYKALLLGNSFDNGHENGAQAFAKVAPYIHSVLWIMEIA